MRNRKGRRFDLSDNIDWYAEFLKEWERAEGFKEERDKLYVVNADQKERLHGMRETYKNVHAAKEEIIADRARVQKERDMYADLLTDIGYTLDAFLIMNPRNATMVSLGWSIVNILKRAKSKT